MRDIPGDSDIPRQVQVHRGLRASFTLRSSDDGEAPASSPAAAGDSVRAVLKYRSEKGRKAILAAAKAVHHDFGPFNSSLAVSLSPANLEDVKSNPDVEWFEGDGRVIYCSIR